MNNYTKQDDQQILKLLNSETNLTYDEIGQELGRSGESVRSRLKYLRMKGKDIPHKKINSQVINHKNVETDVSLLRLSKQNSILKKQYKAAITKIQQMREVTGILTDHIDVLPPIPRPKHYRRIKKSNRAESINALLSDFHIGERITAAETNGFNEYNLQIFKERLKFLEEKRDRYS